MKRLLIILFVLVFIAAIPLSHNLMAKAKPAKVTLCHITHTTDTHYIGHVIVVSPNAVKAHCSRGDHDPSPGKKAGDYCQRMISNTGNTCDGNPAVPPK